MPVCHPCDTCTNVMVLPYEERHRKYTAYSRQAAAPRPLDRLAAR